MTYVACVPVQRSKSSFFVMKFFFVEYVGKLFLDL